ncbi:hypothetical protein ACWD33_09615 [Streptomyces xiamenensis]|uniref:Uncharacterized protein n=1 Tax=Streptomyces xiamenensis TaxID=408015 RepID=A0A0F7CN55_9ACTN|nr:hypothetical protein SXIM_09370 [Streptomyces xiamenensis]
MRHANWQKLRNEVMSRPGAGVAYEAARRRYEREEAAREALNTSPRREHP